MVIDILKLEILGEPVAWSAPKIFRQGQKKSERLVHWQTSIKIQTYQQIHDFFDSFEMWDCPIFVRHLIIRRTKPKSVKSKWPDKKPDIDNFIKAVFDALEGTIYTNDSRIVYMNGVQKIWATEENSPGVSLQIERLR